MLKLPNDLIHVWSVIPEQAFHCMGHLRLQAFLSKNEIIKSKEIRSVQKMIEYLVTRAFVRHCLSRYFSMNPNEFEFEFEKAGRPKLVTKKLNSDLYFSISHTAGLVSCAFSRFPDLGLDVEKMSSGEHLMEMSSDILSVEELSTIEPLSQNRKLQILSEIWTLKEAYLKALGIGMVDDLRSFGIKYSRDLVPTGINPGLSFRDHSNDWLLRLFRPTSLHQMGIVYKAIEKKHIKIEHYWLDKNFSST